MARYAMLFDLNRCSGCYNCFLACKDENCGNDHLPTSKAQPEMGHFWMNIVEKERGQYPKVKVASIPVTCMQCEDAACMKQAKNDAVYRRADGVVIIDPVKAKGQKQLVDSCPYGVIYWNEQEQIAQKCTMCAHLLDAGWKEPRCVESCPTGAMIFGDIDDPNSAIAKSMASAEELCPEKGGSPRNKYIGVPKKFVAGTVHYGDVAECAENASVKISGAGVKAETRTNFFGDFEFEGLPEGKFEVTISQPGYRPQSFKVTCAKDVCLGKILLKKM